MKIIFDVRTNKGNARTMDDLSPAHIVILDDDNFLGPLLKYIAEEAAADINIQANVVAFHNDDDAVEYIVKNADNVALVIQDMFRLQSRLKYLERWRGIRSRGRNTIGIGWSGGEFYYYVVDAFIPEASCIFHSAYFSPEEVRILSPWSARDSRISWLHKPSREETMKDTVGRHLIRWSNRLKITSIDNENRLVAPVAEEVAVLCGVKENYLDGLSPRDFERMIEAILRNHGFQTELTAPTRDGGYDIVAISGTGLDKEVMLVEVKRWGEKRGVPVGVVRGLCGVMGIREASRAMLVTTSYVTRDAKREFSRVIPTSLELVEREKVIAWCKQYRNDILSIAD